MNKSECFKLAQMAVIEAAGLTVIEKVETLKLLISEGNLAEYVEEQERIKALKEGAE